MADSFPFKKTVTFELVRDVNEILLPRLLWAIGDLLITGAPQVIGSERANMLVHRDGSITTGSEDHDARGLAGSWRVE